MESFTLPQTLCTMEGIRQILSYDNNCILHKTLTNDIINAEALVASHVIIYMIEGNAQVNTYDGEEVYVSKGDMLFMPRDSYIISDYISEGKDVEVYLLFFDHQIALKFLSTQNNMSAGKQTLCRLIPSDNILAYFSTIDSMEIQNRQDKHLLELKLLEFLHLVIQNDKVSFIETLQSSEQHKQKRNIVELMDIYFDKNLSIVDYAALSGRSLSTFNRIFKQKYGQTPRQWLIVKKLQKANLLLEEGKNVTDTAFEIGYHNVSHFIRAYKAIYKQTPKEMQQQL